MDTLLDWWLSLFHHGLIGPLIALVVAAFVVLLAGNAVVWTLVGLKSVGRSAAAGYQRGRAR